MNKTVRYLLIELAVVASLLLVANALSAQNVSKQGGRYAVLVQSQGHLRKAVRTAQAMQSSHRWGDFQLILCAKLVSELPNNKELAPWFDQAQSLGVKTVVCGMSVANFEVDTATLHPALQVVPNAFIYTFDLQDQDYNTLVF